MKASQVATAVRDYVNGYSKLVREELSQEEHPSHEYCRVAGKLDALQAVLRFLITLEPFVKLDEE